ncbi:MAG: DUF4142 domain-containing protein [Acidobacteriota bacterium]|nr:DUF4142 domain-containing protein [Acidobacteriota bacterium]
MSLAITLSLIAGGAVRVQAAPSPDPRQIVLSTMHAVNEMEMHLGQAAQQKGAAEMVRRYGDRLYRDHHFADQKVQMLSKAQGQALLPPPELPSFPKMQQMMQKQQQLQQMSGAAFDAMFLQMMIEGHDTAISNLENALGKLPAGEVRDLVSKVVPILRQHLELAKLLGTSAGG